MSCTKTMYPFKEWAQNLSGGAASRSGRETARGDAYAGILQKHAAAQWDRGNPQRVGARAWA